MDAPKTRIQPPDDGVPWPIYSSSEKVERFQMNSHAAHSSLMCWDCASTMHRTFGCTGLVQSTCNKWPTAQSKVAFLNPKFMRKVSKIHTHTNGTHSHMHEHTFQGFQQRKKDWLPAWRGYAPHDYNLLKREWPLPVIITMLNWPHIHNQSLPKDTPTNTRSTFHHN